jgi:hypothetical protein
MGESGSFLRLLDASSFVRRDKLYGTAKYAPIMIFCAFCCLLSCWVYVSTGSGDSKRDSDCMGVSLAASLCEHHELSGMRACEIRVWE